MLIDSQMIDWNFDTDTNKVIAITDNLTSNSLKHDFKEYTEMLFDNDKQMALMTVNYQDSIYKILDEPEFRELYKRFSENFTNQLDLESDKFLTKNKIKIIDSKWIENLFNTSNYKKYKKAWRKFYKSNPSSPGYFEFSKIEYSDNYGLVYFVHRAKPLIGGGKLIFLKKVNGDWIKYDTLTIWYN